MIVRPWGHIDWLLRWYVNRKWMLISGVGFEPRCTAVFEHIAKVGIPLDRAIALRLDDPFSEFTSIIEDRTEEHKSIISECISGIEFIRAPLMESAIEWISLVDRVCQVPNSSVLLDLSTLPKRVGLLILRQLIRNDSVRDILVCYVGAEGYKEGHLVLNELPPASLPGFGLVSSEPRKSAFFVSVGYSTFDLRQILQQTSFSDLQFLMPFPPASPSFRRTWRFLKNLNERIELTAPQIRRFNAVDMFGVYEWLIGNLDREKNTTMLPLGPKPHSIAMALVQMQRQNCSELVYPQPQRYHPDYSYGVALDTGGRAGIVAYGLRREHLDVLTEMA